MVQGSSSWPLLVDATDLCCLRDLMMNDAMFQGSNPHYLKNMLKPYEPLQSLHSSTMDLLTVPQTDTSFGLRRFSVAGSRIWNGLPHELRQCNTLPCFKSHLKTLLPPSHGQLAPHSQVVPPIAFLRRSLRALNKFMTGTDTDSLSFV